MRDKVAGSDNRASHQLREEADIESIVKQALQRFQFASVDIDGIAQRLERKERDTHRQEDIQGMELPTPQRCQHLIEEIRIFEICQQAQVYQQAQENVSPLHTPMFIQFAFPGSIIHLHVIDGLRYQPVAASYHSQQEEIETTALVVEIVREGCDKENTQGLLVPKTIIDQGKSHKQEQEEARAEDHGRLRVISQLIQHQVPVQVFYYSIQFLYHFFR